MADSAQQMIDTIAEDRIDDVNNLVTAGVDVNHRTDEGFTALGQALRAGNTEVVRLLLDAGASPHTKVSFGPGPDQMPAIYIAVKQNRMDLMALLLEAGADPDSWFEFDSGNMTVLMHAARDGNLPAVDLLMSHGCDIHKKCSDGANVLEYARCLPEDVALWQRLLDAGADPHGSGWIAPLHHASEGASADIVKLLLAVGASIEALAYRKFTALTTAVLNGAPNINIKPEDDEWIEIVRVLVEAGVDVTHKDEYGKNALQHAIGVRSYRDGFHSHNCEASQRVVALIQAEFDRRKAAALSVLPKHMPPELGALVLKLALLMEATSEK